MNLNKDKIHVKYLLLANENNILCGLAKFHCFEFMTPHTHTHTHTHYSNWAMLLQTLFLPPILLLSSLCPSFLPFSLLSLFFIIGEAICLLICGFSKFSFSLLSFPQSLQNMEKSNLFVSQLKLSVSCILFNKSIFLLKWQLLHNLKNTIFSSLCPW